MNLSTEAKQHELQRIANFVLHAPNATILNAINELIEVVRFYSHGEPDRKVHSRAEKAMARAQGFEP